MDRESCGAPRAHRAGLGARQNRRTGTRPSTDHLAVRAASTAMRYQSIRNVQTLLGSTIGTALRQSWSRRDARGRIGSPTWMHPGKAIGVPALLRGRASQANAAGTEMNARGTIRELGDVEHTSQLLLRGQASSGWQCYADLPVYRYTGG